MEHFPIVGRRPKNNKMNWLKLALKGASFPLFAILVCIQPASGQIPTKDASVIPQLAQTAQTLSQQLSQVQQFQSHIQNTIRALGGVGALPQNILQQLMGQLHPQGQISGWSSPDQACVLDSCGDFLREGVFQSFARTGVPPLPSSADFAAQKDYVERRFFSPSDLDVQGRQQILEERARAARAAARDGYALALAVRERITRSPQEAQMVVQVGSSGTTMREDIQRLSAIMMAIYQERQQQLALYAALLEVESSSILSSDPNILLPSSRISQPPTRGGASLPARQATAPSQQGGGVPQSSSAHIHSSSPPVSQSTASSPEQILFSSPSIQTNNSSLVSPSDPPSQEQASSHLFSGALTAQTPIPGQASTLPSGGQSYGRQESSLPSIPPAPDTMAGFGWGRTPRNSINADTNMMDLPVMIAP